MVAACIFSIRVHRTVNEQTEQRFPFERDCCSSLFSSMFLFDQDVVQTVLVPILSFMSLLSPWWSLLLDC